MADPDLQISGGGGEGGAGDEGRSQKLFFRPFGPQFGVTIMGVPPGPLPWMRHCLPTRANLCEPTFLTFPFKTWQTVYMRNQKLDRLEG